MLVSMIHLLFFKCFDTSLRSAEELVKLPELCLELINFGVIIHCRLAKSTESGFILGVVEIVFNLVYRLWVVNNDIWAGNSYWFAFSFLQFRWWYRLSLFLQMVSLVMSFVFIDGASSS